MKSRERVLRGTHIHVLDNGGTLQIRNTGPEHQLCFSAAHFQQIPGKLLHGYNQEDFVFIRPPGVELFILHVWNSQWIDASLSSLYIDSQDWWTAQFGKPTDIECADVSVWRRLQRNQAENQECSNVQHPKGPVTHHSAWMCLPCAGWNCSDGSDAKISSQYTLLHITTQVTIIEL